MIEALINRPERGLAALMALQAALWTLAPALTHTAPPLDVIESALWGREWVWATYKHPSLPGWALEGARMLAGDGQWPAYALSQIAVCLTYWAVYRLGVDLFGATLEGRQRALGGVLLLSTLYYMSLPTPEWNHNVPQLPLYALAIWMLWRATERGAPAAWIAFGALCGLGLHVKYAFGVLFPAALIWMLIRGGWRLFLGPGPWLGLAACLLVAAPQAAWLIANDFPPFDYAGRRMGQDNASLPLKFLGAQALNHSAMIALAALAGLIALRRSRGGGVSGPAQRFLLVLGLGPVAVLTLTGLISGARLKDMWGYPLFTLSGLLIIALCAARMDMQALKRLALGAGALLLLAPIGHGAVALLGETVRDKPLRTQWPQAAIAARMSALWREETGAPLGVVAGGIWTAGLVAYSAPDAPSVFTDADPGKSPWITRDRLRRAGALAVWASAGTTPEAPPPGLAALIGEHPLRAEAFPWPRHPNRPPLILRYAIIPPGAAPSIP